MSLLQKFAEGVGSLIPLSSPATHGGCTTATSSVHAAMLRLRADSPLSGQRFRLRRPSLRRRPRRGRQGVQVSAISLLVGRSSEPFPLRLLYWPRPKDPEYAICIEQCPDNRQVPGKCLRERSCSLWLVWWSACNFRFSGGKCSLSFWTLG